MRSGIKRERLKAKVHRQRLLRPVGTHGPEISATTRTRAVPLAPGPDAAGSRPLFPHIREAFQTDALLPGHAGLPSRPGARPAVRGSLPVAPKHPWPRGGEVAAYPSLATRPSHASNFYRDSGSNIPGCM